MRLSVNRLRRVVRRDIAIQVVPQQLTSYSGLELLRRDVRQLSLPGRRRAAWAGLGRDYGCGPLAVPLMALFYIGARRLEHLQDLAGDPPVARFGGLRRLPLEFRGNAASFQRDVFRLLAAGQGDYAIKARYWSWLPLKRLAAECPAWQPLAPGATGFACDLSIPQRSLQLRVMLYRRHVRHETLKHVQLDLFTPTTVTSSTASRRPIWI